MAKVDGDVLGRLLQEVFSDRDGAKRLLEHLVNQARAAGRSWTGVWVTANPRRRGTSCSGS